jgi:predicted metalloprotease
MSFNDGSQLDPSQVQDRRGGMGRGGKAGIGIGGGVILLIAALLGINPNMLTGLVEGGGGTAIAPATNLTSGGATDCKVGRQADERLDCRIVGTVNSLNDFWPSYLQQHGGTYSPVDVVLFSDGTNTGCGNASSDVGPFYCPTDRTAYFDPAFFDELVTRFGSSAGPLAQEYVVAHEFGHHIQDDLGTIANAQQDPQGAESASVRTELQADCYAGIWMRYASTSPDPDTGQPYLEALTTKDIQDALSAASSVGDDRIQKAATGRTDPETWTHGSSEERQRWLMTGYRSGDLASCDTFAAAQL